MYDAKTWEAREELLQLLDGLDEEKLHHKKSPELWSVSENVEHLYLLENKVVNGLKKAIKERLAVEEKELNLEKILLNRTYKVQAPEYIVPSGHPYKKKELLQLLDQSRANLNDFIKEVDGESLHLYGINHRWIGDLSARQWVQLIGFHEKRHINQIKESL